MVYVLYKKNLEGNASNGYIYVWMYTIYVCVHTEMCYSGERKIKSDEMSSIRQWGFHGTGYQTQPTAEEVSCFSSTSMETNHYREHRLQLLSEQRKPGGTRKTTPSSDGVDLLLLMFGFISLLY